MDYELGLRTLKKHLPRDARKRLSPLEDRLKQYLSLSEFGVDGDQSRAERDQILDELNHMALEHTDLSFDQLCAGEKPPYFIRSKKELEKELVAFLGTSPDRPESSEPKPRPAVPAGKKDGGRGTRSVQPDRSTLLQSSSDLPVNYYAVVIGINRYRREWAELKYCVDDAVMVEKVLREYGYETKLMHDDVQEGELQPDKNNILHILELLAKRAKENDLMLVYFAGHGKLEDGEHYLITNDTRRSLQRGALSLSELRRIMQESAAGKKVLVVDACEVGTGRGAGLDPEFADRLYKLARGFAVIAATPAGVGNVAEEYPELGHGLLTSFFLDTLQSFADYDADGYISVDDVNKHVFGKMADWCYENNISFQIPSYDTKGYGQIAILDPKRRQQTG